MRRHGVVNEPAGLDASDHLCWTYKTDQLRSAAGLFLLELASAQEKLAARGIELDFTGVSASVRRTMRLLGEMLPHSLRGLRQDGRAFGYLSGRG